VVLDFFVFVEVMLLLISICFLLSTTMRLPCSPRTRTRSPRIRCKGRSSQLPGTLLALALRLVGTGSQLKECQGCE
jgi:hypothetical protein